MPREISVVSPRSACPACEAPIATDSWDGLEAFFAPESELLVVRNADDVLSALGKSDAELKTIAKRARERVLAEHTSKHRTQDLLDLVERARRQSQPADNRLASGA